MKQSLSSAQHNNSNKCISQSVKLFFCIMRRVTFDFFSRSASVLGPNRCRTFKTKVRVSFRVQWESNNLTIKIFKSHFQTHLHVHLIFDDLSISPFQSSACLSCNTHKSSVSHSETLMQSKIFIYLSMTAYPLAAPC